MVTQVDPAVILATLALFVALASLARGEMCVRRSNIMLKQVQSILKRAQDLIASALAQDAAMKGDGVSCQPKANPK